MADRKTRSPQSHAKRVFIVDDHPVMRQGLAQLINHEPDLTVCGEADTAAKALDGIAAAKPDLALVDITLPGKNGLELIKDLRAVQPELAIFVISMHDESLYAERVLRAGARGYIMKQEGGHMLIQAIRQVIAGQMYVSQIMSAKILEAFSGRRKESSDSGVGQLTDREFEVFQLIGQGKGSRDIAGQLHLSVKTIEVHRANIKVKLKLKTSAELIRHAVRWSEAPDPSE